MISDALVAITIDGDNILAEDTIVARALSSKAPASLLHIFLTQIQKEPLDAEVAQLKDTVLDLERTISDLEDKLDEERAAVDDRSSEINRLVRMLLKVGVAP